MHNPLLETLIAVIDSGSLTQAGEQLHRTPTAVMKQINALEEHLGIKLITRSPTGAQPTAAGALIYRDAKFIIDYGHTAIAAARARMQQSERTFCVGSSLLNPARPFMDLWFRLSAQFPEHRLHLVPFEDDHAGIVGEIQKLNDKFDFLIGVCDSKTWLSHCHFLPLGHYRKMLAFPAAHRLAHKTMIELSDLHGETLMMVRAGDSEVNDRIRRWLQNEHPEIRTEDTPPFYDISVFNRCAESGHVLLNIECWQGIHPGLITRPVRWNYTIPYGLLYSLDPPEDVQCFVDAVAALVS